MHIPVLSDEVIKFLQPTNNKIYVDATIGCGGHTKKIFSVVPKCKIIGIDCDNFAIKYSKQNLQQFLIQKNLVIFKDNFVNIKEILKKINIERIDGIVFDFGLSSLQLKTSRGFSFNDDNLDMRMDTTLPLTGYYVINNFSKEELARIFFEYGEEKNSRFIAEKIVEYRKTKKITSAKELAEIVCSVSRQQKFKKLFVKDLQQQITYRFHPATKVFQAIRVFVNNELNNIFYGVTNAIDVLAPNGRIVTICYHSLEDRIVKNIFKSRNDIKILTKKPIVPQPQEIMSNKSSRSAKLRAAEKL
jgi:16S rRNA (cytosine1402-N4)-methyltransferase